MNLIGKTTINPLLFYSGKFCGYATWCLYFLSVYGLVNWKTQQVNYLQYIAYFLSLVGLVITIVSLFNLGRSTRLGLPTETTALRKSGLYKYSRNPMYIGFNLLTLAAIIFINNLVVLLLGMYSIIIYHLIIKREEIFLEKRFGQAYIAYLKSVRRYL